MLIYLVNTSFSEIYTSINTIDYYRELQNVEKPWYYKFYKYNLVDSVSIPCDLNYNRVNRNKLNIYDKKLYYLHLVSVKEYKVTKNFYWLTNKSLTSKFENLWLEIVKCYDKIY